MKRLLINIFILVVLPLVALAQIGATGNPVIPGTAPTDLTPYVLLSGDADGQTIQGVTGANRGRLRMFLDPAEGDMEFTALFGPGASPAKVEMYDGGVVVALGNKFLNITTDRLTLTGPGGVQLAFDATQSFNITYTQAPPANASSTCTAGDTIDTATFHYYCHATDTWVRVAMATW